MQKSHKRILGVSAIAVVLCLGSVKFLLSRDPDFWSYGILGMSDGTGRSPVFFLDVCGISYRPTIVYLVRYSEQSKSPKNVLEVSHSAEAEFNERTRVMDRWKSGCILLVGRKVGEKITIPLDATTARQWFNRPRATIGDYAACQQFWDEVVSPRIAEFDRSHQKGARAEY